MAPRDLSTQKWLLSTVSSEPFIILLSGKWQMRMSGPMTSSPFAPSVETTLRIPVIVIAPLLFLTWKNVTVHMFSILPHTTLQRGKNQALISASFSVSFAHDEFHR